MSQGDQQKHYRWQGNDLFIKIFLQPNASRNALLGVHGDFIKASITATPVKGEANERLILFLSELFSVRKSNITLLTGRHSRYKTVKVCEPSRLPSVFLE